MPIELTNLAEIDEKRSPDGTRVRVLEFTSLQGSDDPNLAQTLFFAQQAGMRAKIVEITLENGRCLLEPGALYFMSGKLELKAGTGGGLMRGLARSFLTSETIIQNEVVGTGKVYLEPTFGHVLLHPISGDEKAVIVDQGSFYAATGGIQVSATRVKSLGGLLFGGEGLFQTRIGGTGVAILTSPVPDSELVKVKLEGESLVVDGNFAIMRSATVDFTVQKSTKSLIGSALSGEGLLNAYKGNGRVWLAPTQGVYERMKAMNLADAATGKSGNTNAPPGRT